MKKLLISAVIGALSLVPVALTNSPVAHAATDTATSEALHGADVEYAADEVDGHSASHAGDDHGDGHSEGGAHHFGIVFAMFALVLLAGKLGNFVEKYGQPAVIGELLAGVVLSGIGYFLTTHVGAGGLLGGLGEIAAFIKDTAQNETISFLAQFGALLLLFSIGLESNLKEMKKVGGRALGVALIGVVVPFVAGSIILGPMFFGDESSNARLFLGASLVATSVGITASVFRSLKLTKSRAAQTVLGAAVIDDVLGLMVLAMVSALARGEELTAGVVAELVVTSFGFLAGSIILGTFLAKPISKLFSSIHDGIGMKLALAIGFALTFGYLAELFGLEPIIGAFAAGLLLDAVHFERFSDPDIVKDIKHLSDDDVHGENIATLIKRHRHAHVEDLINSIGLIFVPVFFVFTGMQIDFGSLLQPKLYLVAGIISIVAIASKWVAGLASDGSKNEKMLVGVSMVPRGEVGLIFAATGSAIVDPDTGLNVLSNEVFSTIVLVVILTTFVAPSLIKKYGLALKAEQKLDRAEAKAKEAAQEKRAATLAAKKKATKPKKKSTKKKK